ncbi:tripartite tricarboxylate transporter substrate binding protein [Sedimentitalea todarodis]|uniref:Tripartite tricarboxylate transporter substrate binding protein n=1 Tax=Sedimentitalea todarodis TaxID=1631240 RepID=A0ABU3VDV2_9RHOB|nr:tripartite tricarboxylate transporter substrate binding protein [Sedimentitalea todarodis]MDU9004356.1 tripartite tricarboxylate transporter substrate binding protein [Sedimentitalea todarodis]
MTMRREIVRTISAAIAGVALLAALPASARDWKPSGPLTIEIGFGAGGSTDVIGRIVANSIKEQTGWNVIAENKPGGGGMAMFTAIANKPADDRTVGLGVNMPVMINLVTRPDEVKFKLDDFAYLGTAAGAQLALIARSDAPFDDVAGMIEFAKANGGLAIGSDAQPQVLTMQQVAQQAGTEFQFLSTKSSAEILKLLLGGQAMVGFATGTHVDYLETGEMKMLASANRNRHTYAPDTPTLIEQGFDIYVDPWFYFAMSEGTSEEARTAIAAALGAALETEEVKTAVRNALNTDVVNLGPDATKQMLVDGVENVKVLFGK